MIQVLSFEKKNIWKFCLPLFYTLFSFLLLTTIAVARSFCTFRFVFFVCLLVWNTNLLWLTSMIFEFNMDAFIQRVNEWMLELMSECTRVRRCVFASTFPVNYSHDENRSPQAVVLFWTLFDTSHQAKSTSKKQWMIWWGKKIQQIFTISTCGRGCRGRLAGRR